MEVRQYISGLKQMGNIANTRLTRQLTKMVTHPPHVHHHYEATPRAPSLSHWWWMISAWSMWDIIMSNTSYAHWGNYMKSPSIGKGIHTLVSSGSGTMKSGRLYCWCHDTSPMYSSAFSIYSPSKNNTAHTHGHDLRMELHNNLLSKKTPPTNCHHLASNS